MTESYPFCGTSCERKNYLVIVFCKNLDFKEGWQNGYCTGLENQRPYGLGGSNPSPSAVNEMNEEG